MSHFNSKRVVHSTPLVDSEGRPHVMEEECWCDPHAIDCFGERLIVHHPEPKHEADRWWEPIREGRNPEEWTDDMARAGAERDIFRQCSIGWHFECSDWSGQNGCQCQCHEIAERAINEARKNGELQ